MLTTTGIYETHLTVRDLRASVAFYRDRLGLTLATEFSDRRVAFFWVGDRAQGMLGLWESGSGPNQMTLHFAFRVSLHTVLGLVVLGWVRAASVYFRDPDGHMLELICPLDGLSDPGFGVAPYADWLTRHGPPGNPD